MHAPEVLCSTAFADGPGGGNPAGVVLDATGLDAAAMLAVAAEVGHPETVFVTAVDGDRFTVRYFSPGAEVPFCGHATVALAVAVAEREGPGERVFVTPAGDVPVLATTADDGTVLVMMTSVDPVVRPIDPVVLGGLLTLLGLVPDDLDPDHPAMEASAGNRNPVLVLRDAELFHQFRFAPTLLAPFMRAQGWLGTVTVLRVVGPLEFEARNLFPVGRISEDPATGSAAAAVGAYLRSIGRVEAGDRVVIRQGRHVGRPSLLLVDVPATGGIRVTGGATPV
jgi:PhzF family phenazine biosynthesis protein